MSERTKWTDEQWEAITGNEKSLLVSAAAGAGKTAVLVERIIRKSPTKKIPWTLTGCWWLPLPMLPPPK